MKNNCIHFKISGSFIHFVNNIYKVAAIVINSII